MEAVVSGSDRNAQTHERNSTRGASTKASKCAPSTLSMTGGPSDHCRLFIEVESEEKHS